MIASWMIWSVVLGFGLGFAALAGDRVLSFYRFPTRWVWVLAIVGTAMIPVLRGAVAVTANAVPAMEAPVRVVTLEPLSVTIPEQSALRRFDESLPALWVLLSAGVTVFTFLGAARVQRMRAGWRDTQIQGTRVLLSADVGPAAVGLADPQIVIPKWVLDENPETQRLILAHEQEHLWAGDTQLRFWLRMWALAFPWNLALWWQLKRLDLAVELDCDRRVLQRMPEKRRAYGGLLLDVGGRKSGLSVFSGSVALSERASLLERRLEDLMWRVPKGRGAKAAALTGLATGVIVLACMAPGPEGEGVVEPPLADRPNGMELSSMPSFTPFTVSPSLLNRDEVGVALEREYPPLLRDAGIGGTVNVWFRIDATGRVVQTQIKKSSEHPALDEAALTAAEVFRFSPAMNRDRPVPVWVALDLTFQDEEAHQGSLASAAQSPVAAAGGSELDLTIPPELAVPPDLGSGSGEPSFTPFTVRPDITNRQDVAQALERSYPVALRDQGIGGTTNVWFYISDEGELMDVLLNTSSGHEEIDAAALEVARVFEFTPALNRTERVPVWISLDIAFTTSTSPSRENDGLGA